MLSFKNRKAFTLIELLIAITIIGILSAALVPRIVNVVPQARDSARKASLNDMIAAIEAYNLDKGDYPTEKFCMSSTENPVLGTVEGSPYKLNDFVAEYFRNATPEFKPVTGNACTDSINYAPLADGFDYVVGVAAELKKSANSKEINDELDIPADGTTFYYVIKR